MIQLLVDVLVVFFPEWLFCVCGWTGNLVVRAITLGKVNLAWGADLDSIGTSVIGMIFLLFLGTTLFWLL